MTTLKILLAALAGYGIIRLLYSYFSETELAESDYELYEEEHDHPMFV